MHSPRPILGKPAAFSLIELLVVLAVIAVIAGLLLPALAAARSKAAQAQCLNNKKQLQVAWLLYAGDHADRVVPNGEVLLGPPRTSHHYWWAQGSLDYQPDNSENTNRDLLLDPRYAVLGPYTKDASLYRCPADPSTVLINGTRQPRARSISMNGHIGRCIDCFGDNPIHLGPQTLAAIPNASAQFIFIDEHPDSLNTTVFWLSPARGEQAKILSFPGSMHRGAATLSFGDGHVEAHRWVNPDTRPPWRGESWLGETSSPNNPDIAWLQSQSYLPTGPLR